MSSRVAEGHIADHVGVPVHQFAILGRQTPGEMLVGGIFVEGHVNRTGWRLEG